MIRTPRGRGRAGRTRTSSRELEREGERPESVRRVTRLDDIEALGSVCAEYEHGGSQPAVRELVQVGREASCVRRRGIPPDQNPVEELQRRLSPSPSGTRPRPGNPHRGASAPPPDPPVEGNRQVLHDDEDAPPAHAVSCPHQAIRSSRAAPPAPTHRAMEIQHHPGRRSRTARRASASEVATTATPASRRASSGVAHSIRCRCGRCFSTYWRVDPNRRAG